MILPSILKSDSSEQHQISFLQQAIKLWVPSHVYLVNLHFIGIAHIIIFCQILLASFQKALSSSRYVHFRHINIQEDKFVSGFDIVIFIWEIEFQPIIINTITSENVLLPFFSHFVISILVHHTYHLPC